MLKEDFKFYWDMGLEKGASHMIMVWDGWDDYPVFVERGDDPREIASRVTGRIMECWSYNLDFDSQMSEHRANNWEMYE